MTLKVGKRYRPVVHQVNDGRETVVKGRCCRDDLTGNEIWFERVMGAAEFLYSRVCLGVFFWVRDLMPMSGSGVETGNFRNGKEMNDRF